MALGDVPPGKKLGAPGQGESDRRSELTRGYARLTEVAEAPWTVVEGGGEQAAAFDLDLVQYWRVIWKHRFAVLAVLLVCVAIGTAVTLLETPVYTATTTIQIDREGARVVNMEDVQPREEAGQSEEFYQTQYGLLRSRSLAERVIDTLGLADSPAFLRASGLDHSKLRQDRSPRGMRLFHEAVLKTVMRSLSVDPVRTSRLVNVSFDSPDPAVAAQVANSFADGFIATNLERRFDSSSYARDFLEKQLAIAKAKLEQSEQAAVTYAVNQQIINLHDSNASDPNAVQPLVEKDLAALDASYSAAEASRIDAETKWQQAQASTGLGLPEILLSPTIQELSQQRAKLESDYQDQLRVFKPGFPAMKQLKAQIEEIDTQIQEQANTIRQSLKAGYEAAQRQEDDLAAKVNALKQSDLNLKDRSIEYNSLQREVDTNRTLYDGLLQRYKEVGVTGGVAANNISIVDRAEQPLRPTKPQPLVNLTLASILGLVLGGMLVFGLEALDQAIRDPNDVEAKLGLPLLGAVPLLTKGVTPQEALLNPRSSFWEAYYSVRTALQFATTTGIPRSLVITSSRPGEGKSTTAFALALSLARLGRRTLLIDADLRKPSVHTMLGIDHDIGFSNYLTGSASFNEVVRPELQPSLSVVTSGPLPPAPAELLASVKLRMFIAEAQQEFDVVVFDGPPVMGFADAPMIAAEVGGTVLVIEGGRTARAQVQGALRRLRMGHSKIIGVVVTKFQAHSNTYGYDGGYGYSSYQYGSDTAVGGGKKLTSRVGRAQ